VQALAREGTDLFLKSARRSLDTKCKLDSRPGQHGAKSTRISEYGTQLREKQKIRRMYGVLERQFRTTSTRRSRSAAPPARDLLQMLESRLDNVVYRMGFASTRAEARQLVSHKAIEVNGKPVNIPSYLLRATDVGVGAREVARPVPHQGLARPRREERLPAGSRSTRRTSRACSRALPTGEFANDVNEQLVVELYSKYDRGR
jgi:small subunit ribosomal protein S4